MRGRWSVALVLVLFVSGVAASAGSRIAPDGGQPSPGNKAISQIADAYDGKLCTVPGLEFSGDQYYCLPEGDLLRCLEIAGSCRLIPQCPVDADDCKGKVSMNLQVCEAAEGLSCISGQVIVSAGCPVSVNDPDGDCDPCAVHGDDPFCVPCILEHVKNPPPDAESFVDECTPLCPIPGPIGFDPFCYNPCNPPSIGWQPNCCEAASAIDLNDGCFDPCEPPKVGFEPNCDPCPPNQLGSPGLLCWPTCQFMSVTLVEPLCPSSPPLRCYSATQMILPYSEFEGGFGEDVGDMVQAAYSWGWGYHGTAGLIAHSDSGTALYSPQNNGAWSDALLYSYWPDADDYFDDPAFSGSDLPAAIDLARDDLLMAGYYVNVDRSILIFTTGYDLSSAIPGYTLQDQAILAKAAGIRLIIVHIRDGYSDTAGVYENQQALESIASYYAPMEYNSGSATTGAVKFYYQYPTMADATGDWETDFNNQYSFSRTWATGAVQCPNGGSTPYMDCETILQTICP